MEDGCQGPKELRCGGHQGRLARESHVYLAGQADGAKTDGRDSTYGGEVKVGAPGVSDTRGFRSWACHFLTAPLSTLLLIFLT